MTSRVVVVAVLALSSVVAAGAWGQVVTQSVERTPVQRLDAGAAAPAKAAASKKNNAPDDGMGKIENRVMGMQDAIKTAAARFDSAINVTAEEKLGRLNEVLGAIDGALLEVGEDGNLMKDVMTAIHECEAKATVWKNKAQDPNIDSKLRPQYDKLSRRFNASASEFANRILVLRDVSEDLNKRKIFLSQNKDLVVDLMTADEMDLANKALLEVIDSVKEVTTAIDDFAGKMGVGGGVTEVQP